MAAFNFRRRSLKLWPQNANAFYFERPRGTLASNSSQSAADLFLNLVKEAVQAA